MATLLYKLSSKCYKGPNKESSSTRTSRYPWSQKKLRNSQRTLPRYGHSTIAHPKYGLIIYGGKHKGHAKKELFTINPVTLTTSIIPSVGEPPSQRLYSALASFGNFIVLYGGEPLTLNQPWDPSVYILDLDTNRWTRSPSNQRVGERSGHSMLASKNKFYIWGGKRSSHAFLNDLCVFQVRNGKYGDWERITFLPSKAPLPRSNHCSVLYGEKIYIFGGGNKQQLFNDVWVYDIQQKSWECLTTTGFIPSPRHYCSASLINGVMYVHGGKDELDQDIHELYGFKIKNRCWYMFQNMGRTPSARFGHTMTPVGSKLYVIGGDHTSSATKGDDPLTIHILDNDKVTYPPSPDDIVSPTKSSSPTFSHRRTSSPILPPGDRPPSVSSHTTTKTDMIQCQASESTPITSSTLGVFVQPTSSRSTPILAPLVPTPSRSSSLQATPLVSPTCSSSHNSQTACSRPVSSEKSPHTSLDATTPLHISTTHTITATTTSTPPGTPSVSTPTEKNDYVNRPISTLVSSSGLSMDDLSSSSIPSPTSQDRHSLKTSMDYANEKALLLQEIKARDRTISAMKNKEHWWRTQVAKARGIGDQSMETTATNLEEALDLMCFSEDEDEDHIDNNNNNTGIPEWQARRLLFEQLVKAKAEARYIKRDIQAISKSVSKTLDREDRIRQSALDEANHYKTLCVGLLLQHGEPTATIDSISDTDRDAQQHTYHHHHHQQQLHDMVVIAAAAAAATAAAETDSLDSGLELYQAEQERRVAELKSKLDKVLQDNAAMKQELITLQEHSRTNEQQRYMVTKQMDEAHIRAQQAQVAYGTALKRLYFLQKRTHADEKKHQINQHHIQLLEEQLVLIRHQQQQQELEQNGMERQSTSSSSASSSGNDVEMIRLWEQKNQEQQEVILTLQRQLAQATHSIRSLHIDLKKSTSDWSTVVTALQTTRSELESLVSY